MAGLRANRTAWPRGSMANAGNSSLEWGKSWRPSSTPQSKGVILLSESERWIRRESSSLTPLLARQPTLWDTNAWLKPIAVITGAAAAWKLVPAPGIPDIQSPARLLRVRLGPQAL